VRRRACGSHTSVSNNVRMRGRACPEAWVMPVPERVGPKVEVNRHQSQLSSSDEEGWKRGRNIRTPAHLCRGALRIAGKQKRFVHPVMNTYARWHIIPEVSCNGSTAHCLATHRSVYSSPIPLPSFAPNSPPFYPFYSVPKEIPFATPLHL